MKIYIHANCQGGALAKLMQESCQKDIQISYREVFSINLDEEFDAYQKDIKTSDVIISQPVAGKYRGVEWLSTEWIKNNKSRHSKLILFPVIYHRGQLPQCFPMSDFHEGRLAYHDAHALEYFLDGKNSDVFCEDTERSDFFPRDFVRSEAYLTTAELLRRENTSGCDVAVSDIIETQKNNSQPLFSINHPSRKVLAQLGNRILRRLNFNWNIALDGPEVLDQFVMAPYLSTAFALGHSGHGLRLDEMRSSNNWESRRNYYGEVFDLYRSIGTDAIRLAISKHGDIQSYLNRFHRSKLKNSSEDHRKLIETLYKTFLGRVPNSNDVLHHLHNLENRGYEALVNTFPTSSEFYLVGGGKALEARFPQADS